MPVSAKFLDDARLDQLRRDPTSASPAEIVAMAAELRHLRTAEEYDHEAWHDGPPDEEAE